MPKPPHWVAFVAGLAMLGGACARSRPDTSPIPFLEDPKTSTFAKIDTNGDGRLGFEAFHRGLSEHYYFRQGLDLDGDEVVLQVELVTALFELWDRDDDQRLSRVEWANGVAIWFTDGFEAQSFENGDLDADGSLDVIELGESAVRSGAFGSYDLNEDGTIFTREMSQYLFERWDVDGDGTVDENEWLLP